MNGSSLGGSLLVLLAMILMVFVMFWGTLVAMLPWAAAAVTFGWFIQWCRGNRGT